MSKPEQTYTSAEEWRNSAISRPHCISEQESALRQKSADLHNQQNNITDSDTLLDQQLYVLGKMEMEEYQSYLLFKHSRSG